MSVEALLADVLALEGEEANPMRGRLRATVPGRLTHATPYAGLASWRRNTDGRALSGEGHSSDLQGDTRWRRYSRAEDG